VAKTHGDRMLFQRHVAFRSKLSKFSVKYMSCNACIFVIGGDIDPILNMVEVTEEAKEELAKIDNKIGEYACRLCKEIYSDAFGLAQHR
jgi:hypothetical protein